MTKDEQIAQLLTKGVQQILPSTDFLRGKIEKGETLTVYAGFDPTAPTLHIGHAIQLRKLRQFQDLGHTIIFLIGDFTARIGDPTDKLAARVQLTEKQIKNNLALYKKQAGKFIRFSGKNAAKVAFNNRWLGKLRFADIISLASHMTVDQMLKRDMFVRRMEEEKPIYLHEFFYPLMQGYDSVAMNVDGEIGGNDQLFNMLAGRTLLKQIKGKEKFVITTKLLEDPNGKKMGKTEGNAVSLTDTPHDIYGKVMSWPDGVIAAALELCSDMSLEEIEMFLKNTPHPKEQKSRLAFEIVQSIYGKEDAVNAAKQFTNTFKERQVPEGVPTITAEHTWKETIAKVPEIISSLSELRRLVEGGAIVSMTTGDVVTLEALAQVPVPDTYRIGKYRFIRIT